MLKLFILLTMVAQIAKSTPINSTSYQNSSTPEQVDFAAGIVLSAGVTTDKGTMPKVIRLKNYSELEQKYSEITKYAGQVVYHLTDSNTFVGRVQEQDQVENIDGVRVSSTVAWSNEYKDKDGDDEWRELDLDVIKELEYPGFIPVTSCVAATEGGSASIGYMYGSSQGLSYSGDVNGGSSLTAYILEAGLSVSASVGMGKSFTNGGSITCGVLSGEVGQIWVKPKFVRVGQKEKKVRYSAKLKKFLVPAEFEQYYEVNRISQDGYYEIECVSSKYIPDMNCSTMLFQPDFENPMGVHYNDLFYGEGNKFSSVSF